MFIAGFNGSYLLVDKTARICLYFLWLELNSEVADFHFLSINHPVKIDMARLREV